MNQMPRRESKANYYSGRFPVVLDRARGAEVYDVDGRCYIDFFAGSGVLNLGHNHERLVEALRMHLDAGLILHALDADTGAKRLFLEGFVERVLEPCGLDYRVQFCGPTGTNSVEAALQLARKVTGRSGVVSFSGAFHGVTYGSLSVTGDASRRAGSGVCGQDVHFLPFADGPSGPFDSPDLLRRLVEDPWSGLGLPAAVILECIQIEGGVYCAGRDWLGELAEICRKYGILLICDEIQTGFYRTGQFFSFLDAGLSPDMVTLSKSLSGLGLPLSILLMKSKIDAWEPGEHNGTFRANQAALTTATAALDLWNNESVQETRRRGSRLLETSLTRMCSRIPGLRLRGCGHIWGLELDPTQAPMTAFELQNRSFSSGLLVECCGRWEEVLKISPPLITEPHLLERGCAILEQTLIDAGRG